MCVCVLNIIYYMTLNQRRFQSIDIFRSPLSPPSLSLPIYLSALEANYKQKNNHSNRNSSSTNNNPAFHKIKALLKQNTCGNVVHVYAIMMFTCLLYSKTKLQWQKHQVSHTRRLTCAWPRSKNRWCLCLCTVYSFE